MSLIEFQTVPATAFAELSPQQHSSPSFGPPLRGYRRWVHGPLGCVNARYTRLDLPRALIGPFLRNWRAPIGAVRRSRTKTPHIAVTIGHCSTIVPKASRRDSSIEAQGETRRVSRALSLPWVQGPYVPASPNGTGLIRRVSLIESQTVPATEFAELHPQRHSSPHLGPPLCGCRRWVHGPLGCVNARCTRLDWPRALIGPFLRNWRSPTVTRTVPAELASTDWSCPTQQNDNTSHRGHHWPLLHNRPEGVPKGQLHRSPGRDKASFTSLVAALGSRALRSRESQRDGPNPARIAHHRRNWLSRTVFLFSFLLVWVLRRWIVPLSRLKDSRGPISTSR